MKQRATKRKNLFGFGDKSRRPAMMTPAHGGIAAHSGKARKLAPGAAAGKLGGVYKGYGLKQTDSGEWYSTLDPSSWFETKAEVKRFIDWYQKGRGNPARRKSRTERIVDELPPFKIAQMTQKQLDNARRAYIKRHGNPAKFDRCVRDVQRKGGAANAYAVCTAAGTRRKRGNPSDTAVSAYTDFHGHAPEEVVTVKTRVHFHENLAGAGILKRMLVKGVDGNTHVIRGFKGALLAFSEEGNQLFIEGGDQSINLADFGIRSPHETETLGQVKHIDYFTTKDHLGDEGGEATYTHQFTTTNQNGNHVRVKIARYPDLIYRVRDQKLEFSGGSYEIRAEGINK